MRATGGFRTYSNGLKRISYHLNVIAIVNFFLEWPIFSCVHRIIRFFFVRQKERKFSNCGAWEFNDFRIYKITYCHKYRIRRTNGLELEMFGNKFPVHCYSWFLAPDRRTRISIWERPSNLCQHMSKFIYLYNNSILNIPTKWKLEMGKKFSRNYADVIIIRIHHLMFIFARFFFPAHENSIATDSPVPINVYRSKQSFDIPNECNYFTTKPCIRNANIFSCFWGFVRNENKMRYEWTNELYILSSK